MPVMLEVLARNTLVNDLFIMPTTYIVFTTITIQPQACTPLHKLPITM